MVRSSARGDLRDEFGGRKRRFAVPVGVDHEHRVQGRAVSVGEFERMLDGAVAPVAAVRGDHDGVARRRLRRHAPGYSRR
jgi:hypothetical protein